MKTIIPLLALALVGCQATKGTTTAPLAAAIAKAKESTATAIADNAKVRELSRGVGKNVVELDRRLDTIDFKTTKLLELLE